MGRLLAEFREAGCPCRPIDHDLWVRVNDLSPEHTRRQELVPQQGVAERRREKQRLKEGLLPALLFRKSRRY